MEGPVAIVEPLDLFEELAIAYSTSHRRLGKMHAPTLSRKNISVSANACGDAKRGDFHLFQ